MTIARGFAVGLALAIAALPAIRADVGTEGTPRGAGALTGRDGGATDADDHEFAALSASTTHAGSTFAHGYGVASRVTNTIGYCEGEQNRTRYVCSVEKTQGCAGDPIVVALARDPYGTWELAAAGCWGTLNEVWYALRGDPATGYSAARGGEACKAETLELSPLNGQSTFKTTVLEPCRDVDEGGSWGEQYEWVNATLSFGVV